MSKVAYISDFFVEHNNGGAELVDETIISYLREKGHTVDKIQSSSLFGFPAPYDKIILSNLSLLSPYVLKEIVSQGGYIIVEHDYKIHPSRQPWRFPGSIVPVKERVNYDLYANAKKVFVQTSDHYDCLVENGISPLNLYNCDCSIWSNKELGGLSKINELDLLREKSFAIIDSDNWIKNTKGSIDFCKANQLDYELIPKLKHDVFLFELARFPALVFFPIARETCCRLVVEARCLGLNVLTTKTYGASKSSWFIKKEEDLINYLRLNSNETLKAIEKLING